MESVIGDGNCMFRAISFAIHESQDMYAKICEDIVETLRSNKQTFKSFIIGPQSIDTRISNMSKLGTWGTQVELMAAATLPIYIASRGTDGLSYH